MSATEQHGWSYQVVVQGELGPGVLAFCALPAHYELSDVFQLRVRDGDGIDDLAATLQAAGLMILSIRRIAVHDTRAVATTAG